MASPRTVGIIHPFGGASTTRQFGAGRRSRLAAQTRLAGANSPMRFRIRLSCHPSARYASGSWGSGRALDRSASRGPRVPRPLSSRARRGRGAGAVRPPRRGGLSRRQLPRRAYPGDVGPGRWTYGATSRPPCRRRVQSAISSSTSGTWARPCYRGCSITVRRFSPEGAAVLRTLAQAELAGMVGEVLAERTAKFLRLCLRTWRAGQKSAQGHQLHGPDRPACACSLRRAPCDVRAAERHLATILAGEASRQELRINAPMRLARLHRRLGGKVWRLEFLQRRRDGG